MSNEKKEIADKEKTHLADATKESNASAAARKAADQSDELEEGLEETFPGSDAPASTRRSSKD